MAAQSARKKKVGAPSHRVGRVTIYQRNRTWYMYYFENRQRVRRRVGNDLADARKLAAEVNAQLATGTRSALAFEPVSIVDLRGGWLDHHEHVLRSSTATIRRYRAATDHLNRFVGIQGATSADRFTVTDAERFVRFLRETEVSPNGHPNTDQRRLRDKGIRFILEACRAMFNYAAKHRHLPPYHDNPFSQIEIDRIPVEDAKPIVDLTDEQERLFLESCDEWQFPIFLTLFLTGLRPGELTHLLLPDDLDLAEGWLWIRNKPELCWKVKTRNERKIPLIPELASVLRVAVRSRKRGPVFLRRRFVHGKTPPLADQAPGALVRELELRSVDADGNPTDRRARESAARTVWRDVGAIRADRLRGDFMKITHQIGSPEVTAVKTLRHMFATCLQDSNVDPLIRNQLMGHAPSGAGSVVQGLGMTGLYTHTRPATLRRQLETALVRRPAVAVARRWLKRRADRHRMLDTLER